MEYFHSSAIEFLRSLYPYFDSEDLPLKLTEGIRNLLGADNVYLLGSDGNMLGTWRAQTAGWKPRQFSMDCIRKAIDSPKGYFISNLEENPSDSQITLNIYSCVAARISSQQQTIAAFYCDIRQGSRRFSDEDGNKLKVLADLLAIYVLRYVSQFQSQAGTEGYRYEPASPFIGESMPMQRLKEQIYSIASRATRGILIYGERGTGKEIVARMLHEMSGRAGGSFIAVNCGAINAELFESEFFGHEKGAFSGAHQERKGKIRRAHRGTLFLDEVGDIPLEFQSKLLRALETKCVTPVGLDHEIGPVDFRLICATNKNLNNLVLQRLLREDFFDRISGVQISIPPLRQHLEDIPLLAHYFAKPKNISKEAIELLELIKAWPGNVRKLRNIIETARDLTDGSVISKTLVEAELRNQGLLTVPVGIGIEHPGSTEPSIENVPDFYEIKTQWKQKKVKPNELDRLLWPLYLAEGSWRRVAEFRFGLTSVSQSREFINWVYQRQLKNELSRRYEDYLRKSQQE